MEAELDAFSRHQLKFELDQQEFRAGRIVLRGQLTLSGSAALKLIVVYPDTFPYARFTVYAPELSLRRHQHPFAGNLCLLPRGSEYWRPSILAADLIAEQVPRLLKVVEQGGEQLRQNEEPQGEPFSEYYARFPFGGVVLPASASALPPSATSGSLQLLMSGDGCWLAQAVGAQHPHTGYGVLSSIKTHDTNDNFDAPVELTLALQRTKPWRGRWVRLDGPPRGPHGRDVIRLLQEVRPESLQGLNRNNKTAIGRLDIIGIVFPEEVRQGEYEDAWIFIVCGKLKTTPKGELSAILLHGLRASRSDFQARIPELHPLRSKLVSLAGLGSLGSPVAYQLASSLIGHINLLDRDYVEPGTVVRWHRGLSAAGAPKALFTRHDIQRDYPYTRTDAFHCGVGEAPLDRSSPGEAETLENWAKDADLLIDATAEDNVSAVIASLGRAYGIPQIYLWSIEGYGGAVARIVPGRTGCYYCLLLALEPEHGHIRAPEPPSRRDEARVQPRGCADLTFNAPSCDLLPIAHLAGRLCISTLCEGADRAYPSSSDDVFVVTVRRPNGSLVMPAKWDTYSLPPNESCPICQVRSAETSTQVDVQATRPSPVP